MELTLQSEALDKILPALLKAQQTMEAAVKTATNPHLGRTYASLGDVWDAIREPLHQNGLVLVQAGEDGDDAGIVLVTTLYHISGQWLRSRLRIPLGESKNPAQATGSAITYGRRYGMSALLGVVTEDDDGHAVGGPVKKAPPTAQAPRSATTNTTNGPLTLPGKPETWNGHGGKPLAEVPTETLQEFVRWNPKDPQKRAEVQAKYKAHFEEATRLIATRSGDFDRHPIPGDARDEDPLPWEAGHARS